MAHSRFAGWPLGRRGVFLEGIGGRDTTDRELQQAQAAYQSLKPCVDAAATLDGALAFVASSREQDIFAGPPMYTLHSIGKPHELFAIRVGVLRREPAV